MVPPTVTEVVSPVQADDWDRVYRLDQSALPTQSRTWARTIGRASRFADHSRLYRFSDGVDAVLPVFSPKHGLGAVTISRSPPSAWGFGGPLSTEPLSAAHVRAILDDCARRPGVGVKLRPNPLHARIWADATEASAWQRQDRVAHVLDLSGGFEKVWNDRFTGPTRNKVRKAEKAGVTVETGTGAALIDEFDGLFRRSIARWARQQNEFGWLAALRGRIRDPKRKFSGMVQYSEGLLRISIARIDAVPVAGIIVLTDRNAHYTRGAIDEKRVGNSQAAYLLQKTAIEDACGRSCGHYHMGETGSSQSLARFKSNFGAVAVPYAEYRHERIPLMTLDEKLRATVKGAIGFKDA